MKTNAHSNMPGFLASNLHSHLTTILHSSAKGCGGKAAQWESA